MQFNYYFEISSVVFMLLLLSVLLVQKNFILAKDRAFFVLIFSNTVESITNVLSAWGLANTDKVSNSANWWICLVFFLAEAITSLLFFRYVVILCEPSRTKRTRLAKVALIPFLIFVFLIVSPGNLHLIFNVENNVYIRGLLSWYGYLYIAMYIVASMFVAVNSKNTDRGRSRLAIVLACLLSASAIGIQFIYKPIILTGIANAIIVYVFYILIQNPNELKDEVANVGNIRAFILKFENMHSQDRPMHLLMVDIHQEGEINALLGYNRVNAILGEVGNYLLETTESADVFHISNNVFCIVLDSIDKLEVLKAIIFERFKGPWIIDDVASMISVKMGRISFPSDVKDINEFYGVNSFLKQLNRADARNNYIEMTPELKAKYDRNTQVSKALTRTIKESAIQVHYQPVYSVKEKRFTSLEALARMNDSEIGNVPADEFIEVAENNGMVVTVDLMILDKVCEFIEKTLLPLGDKSTIESIQVNISALQCMQVNMDEIVLTIIDRHNIPRSMIVLEITERASVYATELMEKHMKTLNEQGIKFALDDYGTGNSNCSYLIEYPFNKVKFDKSMVWAYFSSETGKVILDGEINMIHKLNIPIVAEGIETIDQLKAMEAFDVEYIQGYYFSKPLPEDELMQFLAF